MADGILSGARKAAQRRGEKTYSATKPCKVCRGIIRYVLTAGCVACCKERSNDYYDRMVKQKNLRASRLAQAEVARKEAREAERREREEGDKSRRKLTPWQEAMSGVCYEDVKFVQVREAA